MSDDTIKTYQFMGAMAIIFICIAYLFICIWIKPMVDLSAPVLSIITFLLGFYYGSSKASQARAEMQNKRDSDAGEKQC